MAENHSDLVRLGYTPDHATLIGSALTSLPGFIIISGRAGCGVSTSFDTMKVCSPRLIAVSIDQVETPSDARQFEALIRAGKKVVTRMHAASAFGILYRLRELGVNLKALGDVWSNSVLIHQTLLPTLCHGCRRDYRDIALDDRKIDPDFLERIELASCVNDAIYVRGFGCDHPQCKSRSGYSGRTLCAEVFAPNEKQRDLICDGDIERAFAAQYKNDALSITPKHMNSINHAVLKMRMGDISPHDVEGACGFLTGV